MLVVWEQKYFERSRDSQGKARIILILLLYTSVRASLSLPVSVLSDGANSWCGMSLLRAGRWDTNEEDQDYEVSHVDMVSI